MPWLRSVVGTLWSDTARFALMRHTGRCAIFSPSNACGRDFMQQLTVDVEQGRAVFLGVDHVGVPQFVVKSLCHGYAGSL